MNNNNGSNDSQVIKQGYLSTKSKGAFKFWRKKWLQIVNGNLLCSKNMRARESKVVANLLVSKVRESKGRKCFEIVTCKGETLLFKAESETLRNEWLNVLRETAQALLNETIFEPVNEKYGELTALEGNNECAECKKPQPEWTSITLGILVCHDCAGAHRTLGTDFTRIKSFKMDILADPQWDLLMQLGNIKVNSIYDAARFESSLTENSSPPEREAWVKKKYAEKIFSIAKKETGFSLAWKSSVLQEYRSMNAAPANDAVEYEKPSDKCEAEQATESLENDVVEAMNNDDLGEMMKVLVQGFEINTKICGTPLLNKVVEKNMATFAEFLLLNGANPCIQNDEDGNNALHIASHKNLFRLTYRLLCLSTCDDIDRKNKQNQSVMDVARAAENVDILSLLKFFKLKETLKVKRGDDQFNAFVEAYNSLNQSN